MLPCVPYKATKWFGSQHQDGKTRGTVDSRNGIENLLRTPAFSHLSTEAGV